jgi:hypothetical protein
VIPDVLFIDACMPETRNAAGVFGSLIASMGNITGAAMPVSSQLALDIKNLGIIYQGVIHVLGMAMTNWCSNVMFAVRYSISTETTSQHK